MSLKSIKKHNLKSFGKVSTVSTPNIWRFVDYAVSELCTCDNEAKNCCFRIQIRSTGLANEEKAK